MTKASVPDPAPNPIPPRASASEKAAAIGRAGELLQRQMGLSGQTVQNQPVTGSGPLDSQPTNQPTGDEGGSSEQQVPYSRFQEVITERNRLRDELKSTSDSRGKEQQELADLRKKFDSTQMESRIMERVEKELGELDDADPDSRHTAISKIVAEEMGKAQSQDPLLRELAAERELRRELGDVPLTDNQLMALSEIKANHPDLTTSDCLALAASRNPSVFPQSDERGFNPSLHQSPIPTGGSSAGRQQPDPMQQHVRNIVSARDNGDRPALDRALNGYIGEKMRKAWGRTIGNPLYARQRQEGG